MDTTRLEEKAQKWELLASELNRIAEACASAAVIDWQSVSGDAFRAELLGRAQRIRDASRNGDDVVTAYRALIDRIAQLPEFELNPADFAVGVGL